MEVAPIVSMHVPKCAGTAFSQSLAAALGAKAVLDGFDRILFGTFSAFESMSEAVRRDIYLRGLPACGTYDLVHGHFALSSLEHAYPGGRFVTIMREPRCRLISHFLFWRGHSDGDMTGWGAWTDRMRLARGRLVDFLKHRKLTAQLDNLFTRFLLCPHSEIADDALIAPELHIRLYHEALGKLGHFGLVDVIENPALEQNVARWLGREFQMNVANVTSLRGDFPLHLADELTPGAVEQLLSLSAVDRQLWIHAARQVRAFADPEAQADAIYASYVAQQTAKFSRPRSPPPSASA